MTLGFSGDDLRKNFPIRVCLAASGYKLMRQSTVAPRKKSHISCVKLDS